MGSKLTGPLFLFIGGRQDMAQGLRSSLRLRWRHAKVVWVAECPDFKGTLQAAAVELLYVAPSWSCRDALGLVAQVRSFSEIPIIVLRQPISDEDRSRALANGADDCIAFPGSVTELLARTRAVMRRARGQGYWPELSAMAP